MIKSSSVHSPIHRRWFCMRSSAMFDALTGIVQPCRTYNNAIQPATTVRLCKYKQAAPHGCLHMLGLIQIIVKAIAGFVLPILNRVAWAWA
jgi:hypothetical protein